MGFFDHIFDLHDEDDYAITGLNKELTCINIYDTFIRNNKGLLVVASSTYIANLLYQTLLNYTDRVLFFPMDDFLTSEAIAISPEFKVERINTLNVLSDDNNYIVITNLMGFLRYLPTKDVWAKSKIILKKGMDVNREELLDKLFEIGYEREVLVNGTGKVGVRGYVIDIYPTSYENAVRIEFWGDTIDSIKYFDVDSQLSLEETTEVVIYPFTEFLLDDKREDAIRKQKYLKNYSKNIATLNDYLDNKTVCYYDYSTILKSYELLIDSVMEYDQDKNDDIKTNYMHAITDIKMNKRVFYYHFDEDLANNVKCYRYKYEPIVKYNGEALTDEQKKKNLEARKENYKKY